MTKKGKFKSKGSEILRSPSVPNTMGDFLDLEGKADVKSHKYSDVNMQLAQNAIAQNHISTKTHKNWHGNPQSTTSSAEELTRLHVHIRKDLADALFEEVFRRKTDRSVPNKNATQRVVIEQALTSFFQSQTKSK